MASATGSVGTGDVDRIETGCCARGGVLHSWSSDSVDSSLVSVGLVKDAVDVDGAIAVEADAVVS